MELFSLPEVSDSDDAEITSGDKVPVRVIHASHAPTALTTVVILA